MCDRAISLPAAGDPKYIEALLRVIQHFGIRVVFHGCEPELKAMNENRKLLKDTGVLLPINPGRVIDLCMDKERTMTWLSRIGFEAPKFMMADSPALADEIDYYPVVVKPAIGGGGSRDTFIIQTPEEFKLMMTYLFRYGEKFLVQEYIGTYKDEYTVGVLHDMEGRYLNSIALKRAMSGALNMRTAVKNLTGREELGDYLVISSGVSHGQVGRFPEVTNTCRKIADRLGVRGAVNIQCRYVGGRVIPFEINPRFSGTTSIRAMVGYNEPDILIGIHLLGEKVETDFRYKEVTVIRSLTETIIEETRLHDWTELNESG
jgi:carbamoyl-phosphate synthase large subunit